MKIRISSAVLVLLFATGCPEKVGEKFHTANSSVASEVRFDEAPAQPAPKAEVPAEGAPACVGDCQTACAKFSSVADACAKAYAAGCFEKPRRAGANCKVPEAELDADGVVAGRGGAKNDEEAEKAESEPPSALPVMFGD